MSKLKGFPILEDLDESQEWLLVAVADAKAIEPGSSWQPSPIQRPTPAPSPIGSTSE